MFKSILKWGLIVISSGLVRDHPLGALASVKVVYCPSADEAALKNESSIYDDIIKWKHFTNHWPFVQGIHQSPVNFPHKGQWHGALMFSLICTQINGWVNNSEADDLWRHHAHYDITVMIKPLMIESITTTKQSKTKPYAYFVGYNTYVTWPH